MVDLIETIKQEETLEIEEIDNQFQSSREEDKDRKFEELESMKELVCFVSDTENKAKYYENLL